MSRQFCLLPQATRQRLDVILTEVLGHYSRNQISHWIKQGHIRLNAELTSPKRLINTPQLVSLKLPDTSSKLSTSAEPMPLNILYEDEHLLFVNKPVGLVVHPGAGVDQHTLMNGLLHHNPIAVQLPRAGIVHRLDKLTSGIMVIAKTPNCYQQLIQQIAERQIKRSYLAVCNRVPISGFDVQQPIGRNPRQRTKMAVRASGRYALTQVQIRQKFRQHSLLQVNLATGRTHQIRLHLSHAGYGIVGDRVYSPRTILAKGMTSQTIQLLQTFKRQALHAYRLQLQHPITHQPLDLQCKLPEDMQQLIDTLEQDHHAH